MGCVVEGDEGRTPKWTSAVVGGDKDGANMSSEPRSRNDEDCEGDTEGYGEEAGISLGNSDARCSGVEEEEDEPAQESGASALFDEEASAEPAPAF